MNTFIPAFDVQRVLMEPWTVNGAFNGWVVAMGVLVTVSCGLVGTFLLLRRMALMGDAISHSILPGLAGAFLIAGWLAGSGGSAGARESGWMYAGALVAALVTTALIEWLHRRSRLKQDAAIGAVFSALFALGVVMITLFADHVDLDPDCVLHGEIGFVPFHAFANWGNTEIAPVPVVRMGVVTLLTAGLLLLFYKELLVSSFDPGLATSLGIPAGVVHTLLMAWLSVVIVSAFESVGAILVVAMLIVPGSTMILISTRLPVILAGVVAHSVISTVAGLHLAVWLDCSIAGAMVVAGCGLFGLAWAGTVIARWRRRRTMARWEIGPNGEPSLTPPARP